MDIDDKFYDQAGREIADRQVVTAIMTRAYSEALGDKDKAIALYIKYRVLQLQSEHRAIVQKQEEENRIAARLAQKQEKERQKAENNDRANLKSHLVTVCKQCGYAGKMKQSFMPPENHTIFMPACKCPKCNHRFDWYYVPTEQIWQTQNNNPQDDSEY